MLNSKSFLCLDFGAGSLKIAEFESSDAGALVLRQYGIKPLGLPGAQDAAREGVIKKAIQELFAEKTFASRNANVCAPGFHVFSKFVKLPPVDTSKVTQIIQYEAQQNVPFPLEEVVWDYQILGSSAGGELEVLLVAIKSDVVEGIFRTAEASALRLQLVDVSPAALYNAFRYNYGDMEGCVMLLDIGAKTSNLLFFEKGKVFARSLNIGANSITQDFAAEAKMRFPDAEKLKMAEGFVSLGGAYEEPDNPHQAAISKIARQVMTRLHIQVNQTLQFYRGQHGGGAPQQLYLAGGGSIMPYTGEFFAEKLNVPVEYFNPFRNVQIDPAINLEELAGVAHGFGEIVGLGLRNIAQCPVELNLVPKSIRKRQAFDQKKPYFIAAVFSLVAVVFAIGWFYDRVAAVQQEALAKVNQELQPLQSDEGVLNRHEKNITKELDEVKSYTDWTRERFFWPELLTRMRLALIKIEQAKGAPGAEAGVWIDSIGSTNVATAPMSTGYAEEKEDNSAAIYTMDPALAARYGFKVDPAAAEKYKRQQEALANGTAASSAPVPTTTTTATRRKGTTAPAEPTQIETLNVRFRAVDIEHAGGSNRDLAFAVENELKSIALLDPEGTKLGSIGNLDPQGVTFTFEMTLKLKEPIKKL